MRGARGTTALLLCTLMVLFAPTPASAQEDASVVWSLPPVAYVDHPIEGAVALARSVDPLVLVPHSDLPLFIALDGVSLFSAQHLERPATCARIFA